MEKLEEARVLAANLELDYDARQILKEQLEVYEYPWQHRIAVLEEIIMGISEEMDGNPGVLAARARFSDAYDKAQKSIDGLKAIAHELVDAQALFPSRKKSQVLTDRITLKSQMPSLPEVIDPMTLIEALVADKRLREFAKGVSIKLDNDVAEAIMRWWVNREDKDIGLEAPQPKILDIKVKPKEE